jgi:autotransporter-associated beta strand protein
MSNDGTVNLGSLAGGPNTRLQGSTNGSVGSTWAIGANGKSTTFSGNVTDGTNATPGAVSIVKTGAGTLTITNATNSYTGGTSVIGGTLVLATSGSLGSGGISASNGGVLNIVAGRSAALKVPTLTATTNGSIDVRDNDLVVGSATPKSAIESLVSSARNGGNWDGPGLTSSNARANASHTTGLGVLSGAELNSVGGTGTFSGQTYSASDTLVKYTYNGDANLDGRVTFDDYVKIDTGFNTQRTGWLNGDFNYSGSVNFDDYVLIDIAFNQQNGTLGRATDWISGDDRTVAGLDQAGLGEVIGHLDQFGAVYGAAFLAAVPEPASTVALAFAAGTMLGCRRRRRPAAARR